MMDHINIDQQQKLKLLIFFNQLNDQTPQKAARYVLLSCVAVSCCTVAAVPEILPLKKRNSEGNWLFWSKQHQWSGCHEEGKGKHTDPPPVHSNTLTL